MSGPTCRSLFVSNEAIEALICAYQPPPQIELRPMPQLAEAVDKEDDWTGITEAASRRKRQNRLNVRAYRRRKALEVNAHPVPVSTSGATVDKRETRVLCWIEDQQTVSVIPLSIALSNSGIPLIPYRTIPSKIIFPLSPDHLITLLQFNVLRASATNRRLISPLTTAFDSECSSEALHILPNPSLPQSLPQSLHPTLLQRTVPHEEWIDIIPHPRWRDNMISAIGSFDEDELWSDIMGGLFEGFPASEIEHRGIIAWSPPWNASGWEITEGFWRKWGWAFVGCEDVLEATNQWRKKRGEEPLIFAIS